MRRSAISNCASLPSTYSSASRRIDRDCSLGLAEHAVGFLAGAGDDGFLTSHLELLGPGLLDDDLGVGASLRQQILAILHDPAGLLDLVGKRFLHLGDQVEHLVAVHEHRRRQRHRLGLAHESRRAGSAGR